VNPRNREIIARTGEPFSHKVRFYLASTAIFRETAGEENEPAVLKEMQRQATIRMGMKFYLGQSISPKWNAVPAAFMTIKRDTSGNT
jgi:hypothetical protein